MILFWRFFGREEVVGIDVLQTDKYPADAGLGGLLDEIRDAVTQRVYLNREADLQALADPQLDQDDPRAIPNGNCARNWQPRGALVGRALPGAAPPGLNRVVGRWRQLVLRPGEVSLATPRVC